MRQGESDEAAVDHHVGREAMTEEVITVKDDLESK